MADDQELRKVIYAVTEFVREAGQALGAEIGLFLRRECPDFDRQTAGFSSLVDMLERAAPELSIIGRRGQDYLWSTSADLGQLDTDIDDATDGDDSARDLDVRPHLNRFSAQGFKSLANVDVPLRPFNILVGANGAGKTSILEGLFMLSQLRFKKPATIFSGPRRLDRIATVGSSEPVRLRASDPVQFIEYEGQLRIDEPALHRVRTGDGAQVHDYDFSRVVTYNRPAPRKFRLLRSFGGTTLLRLDAGKLAQPVTSSNEHPTLRHDGRGLASVLANLAATDRQRLDRVVNATREIIPAFTSVRMPRQRIDDTDDIGNGLELELYGKWIDAGLASEGTMLVLGLMTIVHGLNSSRLLLMDDIERALHPKAQRTLVRQLVSLTNEAKGLQIVCTTHSPYLLDAVDSEDVLVVRAAPATGLAQCRRLVDHHQWDKWRRSMSPGEFWSYVGEDWLEAE